MRISSLFLRCYNQGAIFLDYSLGFDFSFPQDFCIQVCLPSYIERIALKRGDKWFYCW